MEMSTNQKEFDINVPSGLKERQSTPSFWAPLKAIPITSFYKLHRAPSFSVMAEPELAKINGNVSSSHAEPATTSRPTGLIPPDGVALPLDNSLVKSMPDEPVSPNGVELPRGDSISSTVREERVPPNGIHNKLLEQVIRTPGRQPSPLPTHLSIPAPSHYRVSPEDGPGYVAPRFEGKEQQMEQGTLILGRAIARSLTRFL